MRKLYNRIKGCFTKKPNKKGWAKVENKYDGPSSWTEYTDHDGKVIIIYDLMISPGIPNAYIKMNKDNNKNF